MVWARRACACVGVRERWCELELGQIESLVIKAIKRDGNAKKRSGIIKLMESRGRALSARARDAGRDGTTVGAAGDGLYYIFGSNSNAYM